jgi:hypothetical protein
LARHPALPAATIAELVDDSDGHVAEAAAANPSLPRPAMGPFSPPTGDAFEPAVNDIVFHVAGAAGAGRP